MRERFARLRNPATLCPNKSPAPASFVSSSLGSGESHMAVSSRALPAVTLAMWQGCWGCKGQACVWGPLGPARTPPPPPGLSVGPRQPRKAWAAVSVVALASEGLGGDLRSGRSGASLRLSPRTPPCRWRAARSRPSSPRTSAWSSAPATPSCPPRAPSATCSAVAACAPRRGEPARGSAAGAAPSTGHVTHAGGQRLLWAWPQAPGHVTRACSVRSACVARAWRV